MTLNLCNHNILPLALLKINMDKTLKGAQGRIYFGSFSKLQSKIVVRFNGKRTTLNQEQEMLECVWKKLARQYLL